MSRPIVFLLAGILVLSTGAAAEPASRIGIQTIFTPSGWMGDGEYGRTYLQFSGTDRTAPHSPPTSIRITYTFGPRRWAGMYWQNQPDNWGGAPGTNHSGKSISKVTFWARGETGKEVVEFKSGGIRNRTKPYRDSFARTAGRIALTKKWKQYRIDLSDADLSSVIGGFAWVASKDYNSGKKITFHLDDIFLE